MNEVKKFNRRSKSKFLLLDIVSRIGKDQTPYEIVKKYGWTRQRLDYWVNKLKKAGLIRLKTRSNIAIYELTFEGKNFYIEYVESFQSGIRLHNIQFNYPIIKEGSLTPEKQWNLKGLINKLKRESNASIVWNHVSLQINISSLIGSNAFDLENKAKNIADNLIEKLKTEYGFELGRGELSKKPEFAVLNPLIDKISKQLEFKSETAKIDESEGSGELEFFEPKKVQQFVEMPERIEKLESHLINQTKIMDQFSNQMALHLEVMQKISSGIDILNERLKELGK